MKAIRKLWFRLTRKAQYQKYIIDHKGWTYEICPDKRVLYGGRWCQKCVYFGEIINTQNPHLKILKCYKKDV